jgi:hypothetical protein
MEALEGVPGLSLLILKLRKENEERKQKLAQEEAEVRLKAEAQRKRMARCKERRNFREEMRRKGLARKPHLALRHAVERLARLRGSPLVAAFLFGAFGPRLSLAVAFVRRHHSQQRLGRRRHASVKPERRRDASVRPESWSLRKTTEMRNNARTRKQRRS